MTKEDLLRRIEEAVRNLGLGVSESLIRQDFLSAVNRALRGIGATQIQDLDDLPVLAMAARRLEREV